MSAEKKSELWVPTSPLEPNVQRMAWLLFLECWKQEINKTGYTLDDPPFNTEHVYGNCLKVAKDVRRLEQPEKHGVPAN